MSSNNNSETTMDTENSVLAFNRLTNHLPSIGFLNRKKRVMAYIKVTKLAQQMLDNQEITEEEALFVLSLMMRKHLDFQKAASMTALSLPQIGSEPLTKIGFLFANEMRKSLKMERVKGKGEEGDENETEIEM